MLKRQVDMLEKQLNQSLLRENQSIERELFYQEQIEAMQRLLEAPKPNMTRFTDQDPIQQSVVKSDSEIIPTEAKHDVLTIKENKKILIPEHVDPEPEKRGFWSRFFLPNG